jgi:hypothetical protein
MAKIRAFISFDYEHDEDLRNLLFGQSRNPDSPFEFADWSLREAIPGDWRTEARHRIKSCAVFIVICGEHTDTAGGVSVELRIAQEERIPYFLLWGRSDKTCYKPSAAYASDKIYRWTWDNLKALIAGSR